MVIHCLQLFVVIVLLFSHGGSQLLLKPHDIIQWKILIKNLVEK